MRQIENTPENKRVVVSIHAPREGCDGDRHLPRASFVVSIHAPREGCDSCTDVRMFAPYVSIHAPREGCDVAAMSASLRLPMFQFTHPGRGATLKRKAFVLTICSSFNSRTPGGVRLASGSLSSSVGMVFQFTHPGRGATHRVGRSLTKATKFQFTHPGRGATALSRSIQPLSCVSIHAPREGCDSKQTASPYTAFCFNSRTPGGVRRESHYYPT